MVRFGCVLCDLWRPRYLVKVLGLVVGLVGDVKDRRAREEKGLEEWFIEKNATLRTGEHSL
jgi:hypothetical protein